MGSGHEHLTNFSRDKRRCGVICSVHRLNDMRTRNSRVQYCDLTYKTCLLFSSAECLRNVFDKQCEPIADCTNLSPGCLLLYLKSSVMLGNY